MPNPLFALMGTSVGASALNAKAQSDASKRMTAAEVAAAEKNIAQQEKTYAEIKSLMQPYQALGSAAAKRIGDLSGVNGLDAQDNLMRSLESSPAYQSLVEQGETAVLQNASATGGLRGGDTPGALADFRANAFSNLINDEYNKAMGLLGVGQNAANIQSSSAGNSAAQMANYNNQYAGAQASQAANSGSILSNMLNDLAGSAGYGIGSWTGMKQNGQLPQNASLFSKWGF